MPAACQQGIIVPQLVVARARDGAHKSPEHTSCSNCVLFHGLAHEPSTGTSGLTGRLRSSGWLRTCHQRKGKHAMASSYFHPPLLLVQQFLLFSEEIFWIHRVSDTNPADTRLQGKYGTPMPYCRGSAPPEEVLSVHGNCSFSYCKCKTRMATDLSLCLDCFL